MCRETASDVSIFNRLQRRAWWCTPPGAALGKRNEHKPKQIEGQYTSYWQVYDQYTSYVPVLG